MQLQSGVIIFQVQVDTDFGEAVMLDGKLAFNHCGLSLGGGKIIEARQKEGVVITPEDVFLASAQESTAVEVKDTSIIPAACKRALSFLGRPYNFSFAPEGPGIYCSQLITESFKKADGTDYFPLQPMSFCGPDGKTLPFWQDYYEKLGKPIPEGVPGSHPGGLFLCKELFTPLLFPR
ncbi:MAG: hypothetical protein LBM77_08060 [Spirochaetaceae bacterium]|jgi:hypothetical protein|nr:hypothetical protein [Spirochaetaceae bacterium]